MIASTQILLIDDDRAWLDTLADYLHDRGFEVSTAEGPVRGEDVLAQLDFLVAVIDYHMPGIDGGTVIRSLKSAAHGMDDPPLFYLYTSDPTVAKKHAELGFDGVFGNKGDQGALVRDVRAVFRMLQMRAMKKKA